MADNVTANPGSGGPVFATDDIGGVNYPRSKVVFGPDGSATDVSDMAPLPVADANGFGVLQRIFQMLTSPMGFDKALSRQRVTGIIESGTVTTVTTVATVTTVTTATTVGTVTNLGTGRTGIELQDNQNRSAWAACVRARIT